MDWDVFNGDADGICALHQLRLEYPREAKLVTGVKRDIALLARVEPDAGDRVTVLDIGLDKNRGDLLRILARGAEVEYFDHHTVSDVPEHARLSLHIQTGACWCTSALVDRHLDGRRRIWAVVGAFGDNMPAVARSLAAEFRLPEAKLNALRDLGECLNYNAYGESVEDLYYHPAELYELLHSYADPFSFIARSRVLEVLKEGLSKDRARAIGVEPSHTTAAGSIYILPDEPWARRISGMFGNELALREPEYAHAVLRVKESGYCVSIRAPLLRANGADELAARFPTGGGRKTAAGINFLPEAALPDFLAAFDEVFGPVKK